MVLLKPLKTVYEAPLVLRRLFWADLLCWMALMAHSMFCTDYVATVVYGGSAYAERGSMDDVRFDEGVRMGSLGLLLHSTTGKIKSGFVDSDFTSFFSLFLHSLYILQLRTGQHGKLGGTEDNLYFRPDHVWNLDAVHGDLPFSGGLKRLRRFQRTRICRCHHDTVHPDHQVSRPTGSVLQRHPRGGPRDGRRRQCHRGGRRHGHLGLDVLLVPDHPVCLHGKDC